MKKLLLIVIAIVLLVTSCAIAKDQVLKSVASFSLARVCGARVVIDKFSLGLFRPVVLIEGFRLYNPKGFGREVLLDMPRIRVEYAPLALLKGRVHFREIDLQLRELVVITNKEGKLNVDSLKFSQDQAQPAKAEADSPDLPFKIDVLRLDLGRVVSKDLRQGDQPLVKVVDLDIKGKSYYNITTPQKLVALLMVDSLKRAGIQNAAIYGIATIAGLGVLPAGVALALTGKDSASEEFNRSFDRIYDVSRKLLQSRGRLILADKASGTLKAEVEGHKIALAIVRLERGARVTVSARKLMLPKPKVAAGLLYELSQQLR